jgi:hypothetical protein
MFRATCNKNTQTYPLLVALSCVSLRHDVQNLYKISLSLSLSLTHTHTHTHIYNSPTRLSDKSPFSGTQKCNGIYKFYFTCAGLKINNGSHKSKNVDIVYNALLKYSLMKVTDMLYVVMYVVFDPKNQALLRKG